MKSLKESDNDEEIKSSTGNPIDDSKFNETRADKIHERL